MKLLVVLLCLLSERFLVHSFAYHRFHWFFSYATSVKHMLDKNSVFDNPWLLLAGIVAPIILLVSLIYFLLSGFLFGLISFVFNLMIFFYCLGPDNAFYPVQTPDLDGNYGWVGNYFAKVNQQLFTVVFWYILLGPIAALVYRLIALSRDFDPITLQAKQVADLLEWLPARMTVLLYLLVGNFQRGIGRFKQLCFVAPSMNQSLLSECGLLAVGAGDDGEVPLTVAETLVEYSVIVLLVLIACFTIAAWL